MRLICRHAVLCGMRLICGLMRLMRPYGSCGTCSHATHAVHAAHAAHAAESMQLNQILSLWDLNLFRSYLCGI
ncbi:hypothetical protein M6B38_333480 [Iris pallida]|uniref:Secreted protein n=1 Tax=Iris pallida TaxID=29817 RepID=A0AAX6H1A0_IRIPA|nr:hypothetical protein M6B38_333480 [Iris pallida]